jgi:hypothetical protein
LRLSVQKAANGLPDFRRSPDGTERNVMQTAFDASLIFVFHDQQWTLAPVHVRSADGSMIRNSDHLESLIGDFEGSQK